MNERLDHEVAKKIEEREARSGLSIVGGAGFNRCRVLRASWFRGPSCLRDPELCAKTFRGKRSEGTQPLTSQTLRGQKATTRPQGDSRYGV